MHDGVIRSDARMTYTAVNAVLTERDAETIAKYQALVPMFETMRELFEILNLRRRRRGSIDFDLPEAQVVLDEDGFIADIIASERNVAHRIIEEFMLRQQVVAGPRDPGMRRCASTSGPIRSRWISSGIHQRLWDSCAAPAGRSGRCARNWWIGSAEPAERPIASSCCGRCRRRADPPTSVTSAWRKPHFTSRFGIHSIVHRCCASCARRGRRGGTR
jgi:hypothetical protein